MRSRDRTGIVRSDGRGPAGSWRDRRRSILAVGLATCLAAVLGAASAQAEVGFVSKWRAPEPPATGGVTGIATDSADYVYVTGDFQPTSGDHDVGNVHKYTSDGAFVGQFSRRGDGPCCPDDFVGGPVGLAAHGNHLFVSAGGNDEVFKFTLDGTLAARWGTSGDGDGEFNFAYKFAVDGAGNVYVSDRGNHRIQKFTSDGTFLGEWGSYGTGDRQFDQPEGLAVDPAGNVYVADSRNHRIQRFSADGTFLGKWGTFGSGDGELDRPRGLAADAEGSIYVAEAENSRIQKFTSTGAFLGKWGSYGFGGDGEFGEPQGVALDSVGSFYVADFYSDHVQKFGEVPATDSGDAAAEVTQACEKAQAKLAKKKQQLRRPRERSRTRPPRRSARRPRRRSRRSAIR